MTRRLFVVLLALSALLPGASWAYPEFQTAIEQASARNVNCAMCHTHPDGPEGLKPGQIGSIATDQLEALGRARAAFEPGQDVDSPILNQFGDSIIEQVGKQKFLQARQKPATLGGMLSAEQDLDGDGIPDVEELAAGTLPTDPNHGDPWRLLAINFQRRWFDILMITLATAAGLYGLHHLLLGFEQLGRAKQESGETR